MDRNGENKEYTDDSLGFYFFAPSKQECSFFYVVTLRGLYHLVSTVVVISMVLI